MQIANNYDKRGQIPCKKVIGNKGDSKRGMDTNQEEAFLSFLYKDREERWKLECYNNQDKYMSIKHNRCGSGGISWNGLKD